MKITHRKITAAVKPWKTKYQIHWVSPDGRDCLLGGTNDIEKAQDIALEQANEIFDNPWETNERKFHFLDSLYIVDTETEDPDQMTMETEEQIDNLMSEIHSKMSAEEKEKIKSSTKVEASSSFDSWYDSLSDADQNSVDDLADEMGLPTYDECSDAELAQLHDAFVSANNAEDNN